MLDLEPVKVWLETLKVYHYPNRTEAVSTIAALIEEVERLREALSELLWGCENGGQRPSPAFDDARRVLGNHDPLRFVCGPVEEED